MNWDAIGAIGEMIGAAAVVASLLYLALQTRANAREKRGRIHFSKNVSGPFSAFLQAEDAIGRKPSKLMFILAFQG